MTAEDPRLRRGPRERHCGDRKGGSFDASRFVSPLHPDCEAAFTFNALGRIASTAAGAGRADYTIRLLNLNATRLQRGREAAITGVEEVLSGLAPESRRSLLARLSDRRRDGTFVAYYPAIVSALSYLAAPSTG